MPAQTDWRTWPLAAKLKYLGGLRYQRWQRAANPGQTAPPGSWRVWYVQGSRGSGKTRSGAEKLAEWALRFPPKGEDPVEWGVVAPTLKDARRKCVEGPAGLLKVLGGEDGPLVENWNRSSGELYLTNGAKIFIDGADEGAPRVQGENLHGLWADEVGLWVKWDAAWNESIQFAVRLSPAKIVATGTPKGNRGIVKQLVEEREEAPDDVVFTRTYLEDNEANLDASLVTYLKRRYAGTRLGRQELLGEILGDVEGALWNWETIDRYRCDLPTEGTSRTVVAVDPAATSNETSDETGIVAASCYGAATPFPKANLVSGEAVDHYFVRADRSGRYSPHEWASEAVELYHQLHADCIVAEKNQGGEMVEATIRSVDPNVPIRLVWASKGKMPRAEPISALYEQGRVHHVEPLPELESEQTAWVPGEPSPSRMDALVWAITDLSDHGQDFAFAGGSGAAVESPITAGILDRRW